MKANQSVDFVQVLSLVMQDSKAEKNRKLKALAKSLERSKK